MVLSTSRIYVSIWHIDWAFRIFHARADHMVKGSNSANVGAKCQGVATGRPVIFLWIYLGGFALILHYSKNWYTAIIWPFVFLCCTLILFIELVKRLQFPG